MEQRRRERGWERSQATNSFPRKGHAAWLFKDSKLFNNNAFEIEREQEDSWEERGGGSEDRTVAWPPRDLQEKQLI